MAHRCIGLSNRGVGLVSRQFRATTAAPSIALDISTLSLSHNNNNHDNNSYLMLQQHRSYASSVAVQKEYAPNPLDAFRDPVDRGTRMQEKVGRQWSVKELRRKSFEDLHKLWYVLYKEKNMLLTEQQLSRRRQLIFPQPERFQKVQKSMGAIRQVLGERKRAKVAAHLELQQERELAQQMTAELEEAEEALVDVEDSGETTK